MKSLFVDSDIIIDLLAQREPYYHDTARLFALAEENKIRIFTSAISFATVNYVLLTEKKPSEAKIILRKLKLIIKVASLTDEIVSLSVNDSSEFKDYKDALQYYSALRNDTEVFITRNVNDFKKAEIPVMTPEQFLTSYFPVNKEAKGKVKTKVKK